MRSRTGREAATSAAPALIVSVMMSLASASASCATLSLTATSCPLTAQTVLVNPAAQRVKHSRACIGCRDARRMSASCRCGMCASSLTVRAAVGLPHLVVATDPFRSSELREVSGGSTAVQIDPVVSRCVAASREGYLNPTTLPICHGTCGGMTARVAGLLLRKLSFELYLTNSPIMLRCPPAVHPPVPPMFLRSVRRNADAVRSTVIRAVFSCPDTQTGPTAIPHQRQFSATLQSQLSALQHIDIAPLQETVSSEALDAMRR